MLCVVFLFYFIFRVHKGRDELSFKIHFKGITLEEGRSCNNRGGENLKKYNCRLMCAFGLFVLFCFIFSVQKRQKRVIFRGNYSETFP